MFVPTSVASMWQPGFLLCQSCSILWLDYSTNDVLLTRPGAITNRPRGEPKVLLCCSGVVLLVDHKSNAQRLLQGFREECISGGKVRPRTYPCARCNFPVFCEDLRGYILDDGSLDLAGKCISDRRRAFLVLCTHPLRPRSCKMFRPRTEAGLALGDL